MKRVIPFVITLLLITNFGCERRDANNPLDPGNSSPPSVSLSWPDQTIDTLEYFPIVSEICGFLESMEIDVSVHAYLLAMPIDSMSLDTLHLFHGAVEPGFFSLPFALSDSLFESIATPVPPSQLKIRFEDIDGNTQMFSFAVNTLATVIPTITNIFPNDFFYVIEQPDGSYSELPLRATISYHPRYDISLSRVEFLLSAVNMDDADLIWQYDLGAAGDTLVEDLALPGGQPSFGDYQDTAYVYTIRAIDEANNITTLHPKSIQFPDLDVLIHVGPPTKEMNIYLPVGEDYIGHSMELVFADQRGGCEDIQNSHTLFFLWDTQSDSFALDYDTLSLLQAHEIETPEIDTSVCDLLIRRNCPPEDSIIINDINVDFIPPELHFDTTNVTYLNGPATLTFNVVDNESGLSPLNCYAALYENENFPIPNQNYNAYFPDPLDSQLVVEFEYDSIEESGLEALLHITFQDRVANSAGYFLPLRYRSSPPEVIDATMDNSNQLLHLALDSEFIPVCIDSVFVSFDSVPASFLMAHDSSSVTTSWFSIDPGVHYVSGESVEVIFNFRDLADNQGEYIGQFSIETVDIDQLIIDYGPASGSYTNVDSLWFEMDPEISSPYEYNLVINEFEYASGSTDSTLLSYSNLEQLLQPVNSVHFSVTRSGGYDEVTFMFVYDNTDPILSCLFDGSYILPGETITASVGDMALVEFGVSDHIGIPVIGDSLLTVICDGAQDSPFTFFRTDSTPPVDCPLAPFPGSEDSSYDLRATCFDRAGNYTTEIFNFHVMSRLDLTIEQDHFGTTLNWFESEAGWSHHLIDSTFTTSENRVWFGNIYAEDDLLFVYDAAITNPEECISIDGVPVTTLQYDYDNYTITAESFGSTFPGEHTLSFSFTEESSGRVVSDSTLFGFDNSELTALIMDTDEQEELESATFVSGFWAPGGFHLIINDPVHFQSDSLTLSWICDPDTINLDSLSVDFLSFEDSTVVYDCTFPNDFDEHNPGLIGNESFLLNINFYDVLNNSGSATLLCNYQIDRNQRERP